MQSQTEIPLNPGVGSALSCGWHNMKANFLVFFLATLVMMVLDAVGSDGSNYVDKSAFLDLMVFAYWLLFLPVIDYGVDLVFLRGVRHDEVDIKDIASGFYRYLNVVLASLLVFGLVGISLVAFIVPGIYVACRLVFVSYLVMDEELDPVAAVEASWRITKGNVLKVLGLGMIAIPITLGGFMLLIVGVIPAVMWIKASFAALYLSITEEALDDDLADEDVA